MGMYRLVSMKLIRWGVGPLDGWIDWAVAVDEDDADGPIDDGSIETIGGSDGGDKSGAASMKHKPGELGLEGKRVERLG